MTPEQDTLTRTSNIQDVKAPNEHQMTQHLKRSKENMLTRQIREQSMVDDRILAVMNEAQREKFVPEAYRSLAFAETNIPIGHDQVMMRPHDEAMMLQALAIQPEESILEVGTGTGYVTALLSKLGRYVRSLDIFPDFIDAAHKRLSHIDGLSLDNIELVVADVLDVLKDVPGDNLFDVIVVEASMPKMLAGYRERLNKGGRLFAVIGDDPTKCACVITRISDNEWKQEKLFVTMLPEMVHLPVSSVFEF